MSTVTESFRAGLPLYLELPDSHVTFMSKRKERDRGRLTLTQTATKGSKASLSRRKGTDFWCGMVNFDPPLTCADQEPDNSAFAQLRWRNGKIAKARARVLTSDACLNHCQATSSAEEPLTVKLGSLIRERPTIPFEHFTNPSLSAWRDEPQIASNWDNTPSLGGRMSKSGRSTYITLAHNGRNSDDGGGFEVEWSVGPVKMDVNGTTAEGFFYPSLVIEDATVRQWLSEVGATLESGVKSIRAFYVGDNGVPVCPEGNGRHVCCIDLTLTTTRSAASSKWIKRPKTLRRT